VPSKNRFSVLEVDDGAVDHANNCDPVFTHIGLKADNTVISKETEKEKASERRKFIRTGRVDVPEILIEIKTVDTGERVSVKALLDSGATECFIDEEFVKKNGLNITPMCHPAKLFNVDGTENQSGKIKATVDLMVFINGHSERARFFVCGLGKILIILGETWLKVHNPEIDWNTGDIKFTRCPRKCKQYSRKVKIDVSPAPPSIDEEKVICVMIGPEERHMAVRNISQNLAIEAEKKKLKKLLNYYCRKQITMMCMKTLIPTWTIVA